ncbi:hypothetical protein P691DRAFT_789851, partial [Macrolepiota fuliginosa MF-IS2]
DVSVPISLSPVTTPSIKSEDVKSFGTIEADSHVNGKFTLSSRSSMAVSLSTTSPSTFSPVVSVVAYTPATKPVKTGIVRPLRDPSSTLSSQPALPYYEGHYPQPVPPGGPHKPPHDVTPISPRNPPIPPNPPEYLPCPIQPQILMGNISPPPPTPSTASSRLNVNSSAFVPTRSKVTLKRPDGTEINLDNLKQLYSVPTNNATTNGLTLNYRRSSSGTLNRRSVRLEAPEQRNRRLAEEGRAMIENNGKSKKKKKKRAL